MTVDQFSRSLANITEDGPYSFLSTTNNAQLCSKASSLTSQTIPPLHNYNATHYSQQLPLVTKSLPNTSLTWSDDISSHEAINASGTSINMVTALSVPKPSNELQANFSVPRSSRNIARINLNPEEVSLLVGSAVDGQINKCPYCNYTCNRRDNYKDKKRSYNKWSDEDNQDQ